MERATRRKANLSLVRNINYELIWRFLSEKGKSTIPSTAATTGLSLPTVTRAIDFGVQIGMVVTAEMAESARGRKAQLYMLNSDFSYFLLLLLDNNGLHFEVRDLLGRLIEADIRPVIYENVLSGIEEIFEHCLGRYSNISNAAVAISGICNDGVVLNSWTLPNLDGFPLQKHLEDKFGLETILENNVKAVTMAAKKYVKNYDDKIIVSFEYGHTGYGAGVLVNGEILHGLNGGTGELGYLPLNYENIDRTRLYSQSLQSLIAILNPHAVILYNGGTETNIATIEDSDVMISQMLEVFPEYAHPYIIKSNDFINDCFYSLNTLCIKSLNSSLRVRGAI